MKKLFKNIKEGELTDSSQQGLKTTTSHYKRPGLCRHKPFWGICLLLTIYLLNSCEINQKEIEPSDSFIKIYNSPETNKSYYPEGICNTGDGYLILSALKEDSSQSEYPKTNIIKTNELGEVVWSQEYNWRSPAGRIAHFNGEYGFVAMNNNLNAFFNSINLSDGSIQSSQDLETQLPLATYASNNNLVVLSFEQGRKSIINFFDASFSKTSTSFDVGDDLHISIQRNMNKTNVQYAFYIGSWTENGVENYFVNCINNHTLGVHFFNNTGNSTNGTLISYQKSNYISSLIPLAENNFAFSHISNSSNYIITEFSFNQGAYNFIDEAGGQQVFELTRSARMSSIKAQFDGSDYLLFAGATNSNSCAMYLYDSTAAEPIKSVYTEFANSFELCEIIQETEDEGIVALGQLYVNGKYPRPVVFKVAKREFIEEE